ncbi:MAG: adenylate kinase, partial [Peptostreptococcaceae bacterium]|nr:adenylate kinase [Peptostreptococcaceae bacterium]
AVGRRICKSCGATYHVECNPPKVDGVRDVCGGELYQRADDNEETVSKRIQVYLDETKPLVNYYSEEGIIANINGQQSIDNVFGDIVEALGSEK